MAAIGKAGWRLALRMVLGTVAAAGWPMAPVRASTPPGTLESMLDPSADPRFDAGRKVYREVCSGCHDTGAGRAPLRIVLLQLPPEMIRKVLTAGPMRAQAAALSAEDKTAVAEFLAARPIGSDAPPPPFLRCTGAAARFDYRQPPVLDGIGFDPAGTHAIPDRVAGIGRADLGRLRLKWAFAVPGATRLRSQPVLAGGALYFGGSTGQVFALDRATGCVRWSFSAPSEVRTAVQIERWRAGNAEAHPRAWFADITGNVYALDAVTGRLLWRKHVTEHPGAGISATPALWRGVLYVPTSSLEEASAADPHYPCCTFRGSVVALDARSGRQLWRRWTVAEPKPMAASSNGTPRFGPSGVAVWNPPAIDAKRGLLVFGTGNTYSSPDGRSGELSNSIVALNLADGRVRWHAQVTPNDVWNVGCILKGSNPNCPDKEGPDYDIGANIVIAPTAAGDVLLAGQKSGVAWGLDPATGKVRWQTRLGRGGAAGGIHFGMAARGGTAFVPVNDMPDPHASGYPLSPGLYALDAATGRRLWSAPASDVCNDRPLCLPGLGGSVTVTSQLALAGAGDGHLRIYDARDGRVLWDYDTVHAYQGLGGIPGQGGAIAGAPAPVLWHGELFVASGYGFAGRIPGNVMLAFTTK